MLLPGLVSVTFRNLSPGEIIELVATAGLVGIEWGGDIHVPHGDFAKAAEVRNLTERANLKTAAYGSYYRAGHEESGPFEKVLETAQELGAAVIRIWAGKQGSAASDVVYRQKVIDDLRRIADLAAAVDIQVVSEWHGNTLTDTAESAKSMLEAIGHDNFYTYWQPSRAMPVETCLQELVSIKPWLKGLHVFALPPGKGELLPLAEHEDAWKNYFSNAAGPGDMFALLEFVKDSDPQAFLSDAETLKDLLKGL